MEPILRNASSVLDKEKLTGRTSFVQDNLSTSAAAPPPPPRPANVMPSVMSNPYSTMGPYGSTYGSTYGSSYGGYNSYSPYGSYGSSYGGYGGYGSSFGGYGGMYGRPYSPYGSGFGYPAQDGIRNFQEGVLTQLEQFVRTFGDFASILDSTLFAMTSSFRAVLGVAENFGRLRTMFSKIWYSVNIFRFFSWLYRKLTGKSNAAEKNQIWNEISGKSGKAGFSWGAIAMLGAIISAPYLIARLFSSPKPEENIQSSTGPAGLRAKAAFDFTSSTPEELAFHKNDVIALAPVEIQEKYGLRNSGWAFGRNAEGRTGLVPLNYLLINKKPQITQAQSPVLPTVDPNLPIPRTENITTHETPPIIQRKTEEMEKCDKESQMLEKSPKVRKKVSFGETQIFNVDEDRN